MGSLVCFVQKQIDINQFQKVTLHGGDITEQFGFGYCDSFFILFLLQQDIDLQHLLINRFFIGKLLDQICRLICLSAVEILIDQDADGGFPVFLPPGSLPPVDTTP